MKILLACSAGMSTSILEKNMNTYITSKGLDIQVKAMSSGDAKANLKDYDVVLLGPQVRFMEKEFKEAANGKPVTVIPPQMYGLMQGPETVELALSSLENK